MLIDIKSPEELVWIEGDLPDVHSVPYNCLIVAWFVHDFDFEDKEYIESFCKGTHLTEEELKEYKGKFKRVEVVSPWKNDMNPDVRWHDRSFYIGADEKVIFWAWISKGEK